MSTVAIVGAGIGGVYLLVELGLAGHRVRLHDLDDSRLAEIRAHGGVDVEPGGLAAVDAATTDLATAVDGADVIIVVTGAMCRRRWRARSRRCCATGRSSC